MNQRPNIVLFLTDDHGAWALRCYGNREVRTPVLDGMAAGGVRFGNAFTPCPVCSPARACLLTGRTPSQVGIHDWIQEKIEEVGDRDWLADEITLPQLLHEAGYHCGLSGKWHLGQSHLTPRGFDWYFGLPRWQGAHTGAYTYLDNGQTVEIDGNKTQIITDRAMQFVDQAPKDRPFFLNVGYIATHSPWANQEPELVESYASATLNDIPNDPPHPWRRNESMSNDEAEIKQRAPLAQRNYYAAVTDMDRNVGRLIDHLRKTGRLENTIIIYTSDHGCTLGHHGFWGKGNSTRPLNMHETSIRIPLIMRQYNTATHDGGLVAAGHVVDHCVDHYDTFQVLCHWAGVDLAPYAERRYSGRNYAPLARGQDMPEWDETRFGEYGDLRMIRTPEYKLVRRHPLGPDDLFALIHDPREKQNRIDDPSLSMVKQMLLRRLEAFYVLHEDPAKSGLKVKQLPQHNQAEAWRDGKREARGLQIY